MKTYRRILVPVIDGSQSDILLNRAAELAQAQRTEMLVVRVLDTRSGFEPDGPAAALPGESAARRAQEVKKRLDLQLARNNLAWVEAKVVWGDPEIVLKEIVGTWEPDLVVASSGSMLRGVAGETDILTVVGRGLFRRLSEALIPPAPRHA